MRVIDFVASRLKWVFALAALVVLNAAFVQPAAARDRPGTPNQQSLSVCSWLALNYTPLLCGIFHNTASENVRFEMQVTRNGAPFTIGPATMTCNPNGGQKIPGGGGTYRQDEICWHPAEAYQRDKDVAHGGIDWPYTFVNPADFNTAYCVRFRARRTSDQVVSELWSNWACTKTPAQPPAPSLPAFSTTFQGSQTQTRVVNAAPGQTAQLVPQQMEVQATSPMGMTDYAITVTQLGNSNVTANKFSTHSTEGTYWYRVDPQYVAVSVQVCANNASGHACNTKTINLISQGSVVIGHGQPTLLTTPAPPAANRIKITGRPRIADQTLMAGTDMPGSDYHNQPINGTAIDCQNLCRADGKCLSWTWVKPGVQNAQAMCWLKNAVPPSVPNPNTTSGIKAGSTAVH
jgi:hypothetical protein